MTDRELRKLSRLELLELLLEASKENRKLKEKINRLIAENQTAKNIENLSVVTHQVESVLKYANSLTNSLKSGSVDIVSSYTALKAESAPKAEEIETTIEEPEAEIEKSEAKTDATNDKEIYLKMMCFFAKNEDKLDVFPDELETVVRERIRNILERGTLN